MRYPFELDPQIIHHIIYSQAGSIGKALIELLMNSVDAQAASIALIVSQAGFSCTDDGHGFASRDDVVNYFGRLGTPHMEGDATYGRFRLGRGQIMAHAKTQWRSQAWQMRVDTRVMGYHYDLDNLDEVLPGCQITGEWYEPLSEAELMSAVQEIRDLVRYTPVRVELNGRLITRNPAVEKWDAEDDFAWYRVREDGAVSIYNQGVLVRHDPGHMWGVGGLIVSKRAIGLNVSRTEILRKTCPVWQSIAKRFGELATALANQLGHYRKTESRRENAARSLMAGDSSLVTLYRNEEVITLLPGKKHVTLVDFLNKCRRQRPGGYEGCFTIARSANVPRGELLAGADIVVVVHPVTLTRFGCYSNDEFIECLAQIHNNLRQHDQSERGIWYATRSFEPAIIDFKTLSDAFVERTQLVREKDSLDAETLRAWCALRWCLCQYARRCTGGRSGRANYTRGGKIFHILLGESTSADAWTDGKSYIAYNIDIIRRLRTDPLRSASYLFTLTEHEIAHEGDSLDCGHDEAFYQRFHDISIRMAEERQRYMHVFLMKYTTSMESAGKKAAGKAWQERFIVDRVGSGREKRGLPRLIDETQISKDINAAIPAEPSSFIRLVNLQLRQHGDFKPEPDWNEVMLEGIVSEVSQSQQKFEDGCEWLDWALGTSEEKGSIDDREYQEFLDQVNHDAHMQEQIERERMLSILGIGSEALTEHIFYFLYYETSDDDDLRAAWQEKRWERVDDEPTLPVPEHWKPYMNPGETRWMIERNAAAAGFSGWEGELGYLRWRTEQEQRPLTT
ncbi:DNA mismatch repair protein MutL [Brenneria alni]|uniref:DNA mismatch repair protein MutL n=1 Tax=Brenneria alni TaxID=71656 RepID=A0A421DPS2_9GAMM|nr:ATP-binding protein [Brenneria alni]RLM24764.1 DNA mismatch repair protein MutL [Brenneria alni]